LGCRSQSIPPLTPASAASVTAALRLSKAPEYKDKLIVAVLCDSGERYLSVEGLWEGPA
jgi:cysteine synthase